MFSMPLLLQVTNLGLLVIVLALVVWVFRKIRKVHLDTFQLKRDLRAVRRESDVLFAQLHAVYALEKKLGLNDALPSLRGWAGSPDFLLTVADSVLDRKPRNVIECSSGVSTLVVARCLQLNGSGHVYSLEHDAEYADKTEELLRKHELMEFATVLHTPLQEKAGESPWYDESVIPADAGPFEIVVVDGPPFFVAPLARLPALPRLLPRMAGSVRVILDDADREPEREIVRRWLELSPNFDARHLAHEKGCVILERKGED